MDRSLKIILFSLILVGTYFSSLTSTHAAPTINVGDPLHVKVLLSDVPHADHVKCDGKDIYFKKAEKFLHFYYAESYYSSEKELHCQVLEAANVLKDISFTVITPVFPRESLKVKPRKVNLRAKDLDLVLKEKNMKQKIYQVASPEPLFTEPFIAPLDAAVTSIYGTQRVFNGVKQSEHLGTDLRASIGTPVLASNRGYVILADDLFFEGKVIVLNHGMGIFTAYAHLSDMKVKVGDLVERAQLIALSGDSGRISGPHLHWGVKIQGQWADAEKIKGMGGPNDEAEPLP